MAKSNKSPAPDVIRKILLTKMDCAVSRAQIAINDLTLIAVAARNGLMTAPEAVALLEGYDAFDWLAERVTI